MRCAECGAECADLTQLCVQCGAPVAGQRSAIGDPGSAVAGGGALRDAVPVAVVSPARQQAAEPYVPGRGAKVPGPIRRVRRGYSYLGLGAFFGGWALLMAATYFSELSSAVASLYDYAVPALWVCAAVLFGMAIRLSMFLGRASDASSATVTASRRGGRTLVLDAPRDGYPSGLRVRRPWWSAPEMLLPGEVVALYGRPGGTGRVLVSSPAQGSAVVGRGRRRPAPPPPRRAGRIPRISQPASGPGDTIAVGARRPSPTWAWPWRWRPRSSRPCRP